MVDNTAVVPEIQWVLKLSNTITYVKENSSFFMLILTAVSVLCAYLAYQHQKKRAKKDAACDLAREYADTILLEDQIVLTIFSKTGLGAFIKETFPMNKLKKFTKLEMEKLADDSDVTPEDLKKKMENIDPKILLEVMQRGEPSYQERLLMQDIFSEPEPDESTGNFIIKNQPELQAKFITQVLCLANKLEWFSMKCRYGLADEKLLYQSLHQTFLSMVWRLYYYISLRNIDINDKYYTNTIWLFKKWHKRLKKNKRKAALKAKRAMKIISIAQKIIENAGHEYAGKPLR